MKKKQESANPKEAKVKVKKKPEKPKTEKTKKLPENKTSDVKTKDASEENKEKASIIDPLIKRVTGLNLADYKRLKFLRGELSKKKQIDKPTTAQETIRLDKMYQDGIALVVKPKEINVSDLIQKKKNTGETVNFYSKMIEFFDVNYELLDIEEQANMLSEYSNFLNYFTPDIKVQLFMFNRKVPEESLTHFFDIPLQGDDYDDIR